MTGILLNDTSYEQDIRELLMAFYPGETFAHEEQENMDRFVRGILDMPAAEAGADAQQDPGTKFQLEFWENGSCAGSCVLDVEWKNRTKTKSQIKRELYKILQTHTGKELPWGTLTGIRPTKITMAMLEAGESRENLASYMREMYLTSPEKTELTIKTAEQERSLLAPLDYQNGYSLYIGIPFCPTTCLYCSFTSFPIGQWKDRTRLYLEALYHEMQYVAESMKKPDENGKVPHLETVYFGGGTPTSLSAEDLDWLLTKLEETFDLSTVRELTVEAGRPDSITREKLQVLRDHKVSRISINPQTMKQETLNLIGRHHTVDQVKECFHMARELGFDNINMDLIIGLPDENLEDVRATMEEVKNLDPDSITVHSLAIKRAARLHMWKEKYESLTIQNTQEMIDLTAWYAKEMGMEPYYLYRQKNMAGNFENVGYAKPGKACLYNILIMEEKQTILACGAGTSTKLVYPAENRVERVENVKDVTGYIERIEEMIGRKHKFLP